MYGYEVCRQQLIAIGHPIAALDGLPNDADWHSMYTGQLDRLICDNLPPLSSPWWLPLLLATPTP